MRLALAVLSISSLAPLTGPAGAGPRASDPTEIDRRVESILGRMTLEEKIDLLSGVDGFYTKGVPRLGLPRFKMADGPIGVRNFGPATAMAGGIALAATWNEDLARRVGVEIGRDARAKGVHFLLGPGVNIYRAPMNGRNFEYLGEDPFLASRIAVGYVKGVQSEGVAATIKHFVGNNSEFDRHNTDSVIDERALREIYLPVFEAAVREAGVGAIMNSYNLTNGTHMSQNGYLNTEVVRKEWGFEGVMMSDWGGTYDGVQAANGGLDLEMPSGRFMNRATLLPAVEQGRVTQATVDEKVRRILRTGAAFGWLDREQVDGGIPRYNLAGRRVALETAREALVLLKNEAGLLPLDKARVRSVALVGPGAYPAVPVGGGSARVQPFTAVSLLEGLSEALEAEADVYYNPGLPTLEELANATTFSTAPAGGEPGLRVEAFDNPDLSGEPSSTRVDRRLNAGRESRSPGSGFGGFQPPRPTSTRWTGYFTPEEEGPYEIFVQSGGERSGYRLYLDGQLALDGWQDSVARVGRLVRSLAASPHKVVVEQVARGRFGSAQLRLGIARQDRLVDPAAKEAASKADAVVVAVGFDPDSEGEGSDRTFALPPGQDRLIEEMLAASKSVIVVVTAGGGVDMDPWLARVPAVIQAWYPGQEGGRALADVLLGEVNPSGRLPVTFDRRWEDNPVHASYYPEENSRRIVYKEGVFVGYRGYEHASATPLFPFGYGLSYTTFRYGDLSIEPPEEGRAVRVSFELTNTGSRAGAEVAQVYVHDGHARVPRPPKELKGFAKVRLEAGESRRVTVELGPRAFSYYDVASGGWRAEAGEFEVLVGRSSAEIELRGKVRLPSSAR
jgi:beta-glucosidase